MDRGNAVNIIIKYVKGEMIMPEMRFQRLKTDRITVNRGQVTDLVFVDIYSSLTHITFELSQTEAMELSALLAAESIGDDDRDRD